MYNDEYNEYNCIFRILFVIILLDSYPYNSCFNKYIHFLFLIYQVSQFSLDI